MVLAASLIMIGQIQSKQISSRSENIIHQSCNANSEFSSFPFISLTLALTSAASCTSLDNRVTGGMVPDVSVGNEDYQ